jgi:hypothetical protein
MITNANSAIIATLLADARVGTFTGIITTKRGVTRGKGADKKVYGDDQVHAVIFTGFKYERLVQRSLEQLPCIDANEIVADAAKHGNVITVADVEMARTELMDSFIKTLAGTNESTTDHVYEALEVNGTKVVGGRVYKCVKGKSNPDTNQPYSCRCFDCTGDEKAPKDGTVYIQGLRIWSEILIPAVNGPVPEAKSAPKTIAKDGLRYRLPVSKYVSYAIPKGEDWILRVGGTAAIEATKAGFVVTPEVIAVLDKAA